MASTALQALVRGQVQGVGFRWFVRLEAERLGLRGYTRNLPDGQVEVVAVGEPQAVEELVASLRNGPRAARVEAVATTELPSVPHFDTFTVRG